MTYDEAVALRTAQLRGNQVSVTDLKQAMAIISVGQKSQSQSQWKLTRRQTQIMDLLLLDHTPKEIADLLGVSNSTVSTHIGRVCIHMGVDTATLAAVMWDRSKQQRS